MADDKLALLLEWGDEVRVTRDRTGADGLIHAYVTRGGDTIGYPAETLDEALDGCIAAVEGRE